MRILVTGSNGFVGGHLMAAGVALGHEMLSANRDVCDFETGETGVRDAISAALDRLEPEGVIHLAGPQPTSDEERCTRICVEGTRGLIAALDSADASIPLVVAGSASEIGVFDESRPCVDESVDSRPGAAYGRGKLRQSELVLEWGGTTMRLFNSTGPGQGPAVVAGRIVQQLAQGIEPLVLREVESTRDFVDVRDAAAAFLMALDLKPGRYNICSGRPVSIGELVAIALDAADLPDLEVTVEMPDYVGNFVCGDPGLLESLGWIREFTLEETIRDAIEAARG